MNPKKSLLNIHWWLRHERQARRNRQSIFDNTQPGKIFFQRELCQLFDRDEAWIAETVAEYRACPAAWKYLCGLRSLSHKTDGYGKSLDVSEGFAAWSLVKHAHPHVIVELGVLYGTSSRLWKEALKAYVPEHELILCDLVDSRKFITDDDCTFLKGNAIHTLPEVFTSRKVDLLHNDVHPYSLVRWSIEEGIQHNVKIFTFHDVGRRKRGPFRPGSANLSLDEKLANETEYGKYGHWERHMMAEVFDRRILNNDAVIGDFYRIQIFDSLFGFGAVIRNTG